MTETLDQVGFHVAFFLFFCFCFCFCALLGPTFVKCVLFFCCLVGISVFSCVGTALFGVSGYAILFRSLLLFCRPRRPTRNREPYLSAERLSPAKSRKPKVKRGHAISVISVWELKYRKPPLTEAMLTKNARSPATSPSAAGS